MINATHVMMYSKKADELRAFFRDVLKLGHVDAGGGWLIFALPPAELGIHPHSKNGSDLYLMCDDLAATMADLKEKGVKFVRPVSSERWGDVTAIRLPDGGEIGLYQPKHPMAAKPARSAARRKAARKVTKRPKRR